MSILYMCMHYFLVLKGHKQSHTHYSPLSDTKYWYGKTKIIAQPVFEFLLALHQNTLARAVGVE